MRQIIAGSTTYIDRHNERMTLQALESMACRINSDRKPILTIEHDVTLPPIGKLLKAWVEPTEDGEHRLLIEQETFEKEEQIVLPDGSHGLMRQSDTDRSPFVKRVVDIPPILDITADLANFASLDDYQALLDEIRSASSLPFENSEMGRKALIVDPEIIITLSKEIIAYLVASKIIDKFSSKIIDKVGDKLSDDLADFYTWVRSIAFKYAKYAIPKNRPITYIFNIPINPQVELVIRTNDSSDVAASIMVDNLEEPLKLAIACRDKLGAERVQFLLNKAGEWKLNYMLTDKGQVIGTKKSFTRKARQFDLTPPPSIIGINKGTLNLLKQPTKNIGNKRRKK